MRQAYAIIGVAALIVLGGGWFAFNQKSTPAGDTERTEETTIMTSFRLSSAAFADGERIPSQYTCDAENVSPPLEISGVPEGAVSLALLMDDPDIPQIFKEQRGTDSFDHWTLFNIPPDTSAVAQATSVGKIGANGAGENAYTGPCPPPQYEPSEHRYFFKLYALDTVLDLHAGATKADVLAAMEGHILAEAQLMGRYKRIANSE